MFSDMKFIVWIDYECTYKFCMKHYFQFPKHKIFRQRENFRLCMIDKFTKINVDI
jgi:hypothetical protein